MSRSDASLKSFFTEQSNQIMANAMIDRARKSIKRTNCIIDTILRYNVGKLASKVV
jgi:hypothetical protein